ncbi:MAG: DUF835 domain-containing protein [Thermoplasmata archaeon]
MMLEIMLVTVISLLTLAVLIIGILSLGSRTIKTLFIALHILLLAANFSWLLGRELQEKAFDTLTLSSTIMVFPMTTILILAFFRGRSFIDKIYPPLIIFLPSLGIIYLSSVEVWTSLDLYDHSLFVFYLIFCLGISVAESATFWLRSSILHKEGYLFVLSLVILLATGPVYYQELKILNADNLIGPNLGFPLFGSVILLTLLRTNYSQTRLRSKRRLPREISRFVLETGKIHFVNETRPKYLRSVFADELNSGKLGLILTSSKKEELKQKYQNAAIIEISFTDGKNRIRACDLSRIYFSIRDFAMTHEHSVILVDAFPRLVCNNKIRSVRELISSMRDIAKRTDSTFLVPLFLITSEEFSELVGPRDNVMEFPDVEKKVLEILDAHIGNLSRHLLRTYCTSKRISTKDLLLEDIPDLAVWITSTLDTLGIYAGDNAILKNWKNESYSISLDLMSYYNSNLEEAQRLSTDPAVTTESLLAQVVFSRRKIPRGARKEKAHDKRDHDLRERLLSVFKKYFGEAGRFVLAREIKKMGKSLNELTKSDVRALAERAQDAMMEFGEIVDIDQVRTDMKSKGYMMKDEIVGIISEGV